MAHPCNSGLAVRIFLNNLAQWKGLIGTWKFYLFCKKKFHLGQFDLFRPFCTVWAWSKLSQPTVTIVSSMITTGSLNSQDMIRIFKQSRHDFSGKHLCDGTGMDIMWCLCVEVKIQQRVIWFYKASLRNCCVSFLECKGLWMLKTDRLIF